MGSSQGLTEGNQIREVIENTAPEGYAVDALRGCQSRGGGSGMSHHESRNGAQGEERNRSTLEKGRVWQHQRSVCTQTFE